MPTKFVLRSVDGGEDIDDFDLILSSLQRMTGGRVKSEPALMLTVDDDLAFVVEQVLLAAHALLYRVPGDAEMEPGDPLHPESDILTWTRNDKWEPDDFGLAFRLLRSEPPHNGDEPDEQPDGGEK